MYNFKKIEAKWQEYWDKNSTFSASSNSDKPKYYVLVEFPYPSGVGLHVGHVRSYAALDALARFKRMQGFNVLYPIGWDAFGAPAEQYAIKNHIHPKDAVKENILTFKGQCKKVGISFDWSREIATTDPEYYKWTQWQFLKFYENGMAYKAKKSINWCPKCKTGLSNEDSSGGICERCGTKTEKRLKEQWMLKMRDYAEDLLKGLDDTEFLDRIKLGQINWIGKSEGASIKFKLKEVEDTLEVFTTRADTLYGVTFMVMSPEHPYLTKYQDKIVNLDEIKQYQKEASEKSDIERTDASKDKTGVMIKGLTAINPVNNEEIPIWISDYVLIDYGTGAIMAVPAHDDRDYAFAKKFNINIIPVISGGDISKEAYTGEGEMINSGILNGPTDKKTSIAKMLEYLEKNNIGSKKTDYRLQDWVFSRQRFWGEPVPMVYCEDCGWVPVKESDLPVLLPDVASYEPTEDGESPLANITEWVNTTCPKCGKPAKRETDTMPNWAGSSWYWLRYMDAHNKDEFASKEALNYWGKVDLYNGGMEHVTRHLLYARFWNQFLYNIGLVPNKEPFLKRVAHGMILGADGEKMAKSRPEYVVDPIDTINEYGADALRTYEMFIGDYEKDSVWSDNGLKGCKKFLDRIYRIKDKLIDDNNYSKELENIIHKTIKKVTNDMLSMKFNTAVSALMILVNEYDKMSNITKGDYKVLLTLLNPMAPHMTEELNQECELGDILAYTAWPTYDATKTIDEVIEIGVQVNGKLRGTIKINLNEEEDAVKAKALNESNVNKYLLNNEIVKVIVVKNRIVNIIVK